MTAYLCCVATLHDMIELILIVYGYTEQNEEKQAFWKFLVSLESCHKITFPLVPTVTRKNVFPYWIRIQMP